jgi:hypothetical protein
MGRQMRLSSGKRSKIEGKFVAFREERGRAGAWLFFSSSVLIGLLGRDGGGSGNIVVFFHGDSFQDPQWMPEATESTAPYTYYDFSSLHTLMIKLDL